MNMSKIMVKKLTILNSCKVWKLSINEDPKIMSENSSALKWTVSLNGIIVGKTVN